MYERFTDSARKAMKLANEEATRLGHEYIGTEHILLGLTKVESWEFQEVIAFFKVNLEKIQEEILKIVVSGPDHVTMGKVPQTPRAKKALEYTMEASRKLGHNYVGTGHLLIGLLMEQEGVAAQVLMNLGLKLDDVIEAVEFLAFPDEKNDFSATQNTKFIIERMKAAAGLTGVSDIQFLFWFKMLFRNFSTTFGDSFRLAKTRRALIDEVLAKNTVEVPAEKADESGSNI